MKISIERWEMIYFLFSFLFCCWFSNTEIRQTSYSAIDLFAKTLDVIKKGERDSGMCLERM